MEWQKSVSEILVVLTVILIVATVVYPLSVLAVQSAGPRLSRLRVHGVRKVLRRLLRGTVAALGCVLPFQGRPAYFEARPHADRRSRVRGAVSARKARDRRGPTRVAICFGGTLHTGRAERGAKVCDILDLSAGGARVRLTDQLGRVSRTTLCLDDFGAFRARVVWRNADELGLRFELEAQTVVARMRGLLPPLPSIVAT